MKTIAFRGAGAYTSSSGSSASVPFPSGILADDCLLLCASLQTPSGVGGITDPGSPWTLVAQLKANLSTPEIGLWRKVAVGSEAGNLTVGFTSSTPNYAAQILAYSGVDPAQQLDVTATTVDGPNLTTCTIPGQTVVTDQAAQVAIAAVNSVVATATPPTGFTELGDRTSGARSFETSHKLALSPGASGDRVVTFSAAGRTVGALVTLKPAPDDPAPDSGVYRISTGGLLVPVEVTRL